MYIFIIPMPWAAMSRCRIERYERAKREKKTSQLESKAKREWDRYKYEQSLKTPEELAQQKQHFKDIRRSIKVAEAFKQKVMHYLPHMSIFLGSAIFGALLISYALNRR